MTIDMDEVWRTIKPGELRLKIDGKEYPVRRLTVADSKRIAELGTHSDHDNIAWVQGLLGGADQCPPALRDLELSGKNEELDHERRVVFFTVLEAVVQFYLASCTLQKKTDAARTMIQRTIDAALSTSGSSSG